MKKTALRLADGREIIYFDERDDTVRAAIDPRALPAVLSTTEMRFDPLLEEWVTIATHRQDRTHLPSIEDCPLCPSTGGRQTEIPSNDYDVVVFENRFPSYSLHAAGMSRFLAPDGDALPGGLVERRAGVGRCEVVCFTSDHTASFADLPAARIRTVVDAWADRTEELGQLPEIEQVFPFENRGAEIGVTLSHPHGQIYGYPIIAPRTARQLASARRYWHRTSGNLFADILAAEQRAASRIVARTERWTAFVPAAARWPVEVHLYPNRRVADLPALSGVERDDFAHLYRDVLRRCDALYQEPLPYIAAWQQAPVRVDRDLAYLHLELFSPRRAPAKLKYLAGSESGMGVFINDVRPEDAARRLREAAAADPVRGEG
ncbi:MAG TPA: galactose-1-phosphate uridylyltransferase [Micromonosporaceae bacterium]